MRVFVRQPGKIASIGRDGKAGICSRPGFGRSSHLQDCLLTVVELPDRFRGFQDLALLQLGEDGKAHHLLRQGLRYR